MPETDWFESHCFRAAGSYAGMFRRTESASFPLSRTIAEVEGERSCSRFRPPEVTPFHGISTACRGWGMGINEGESEVPRALWRPASHFREVRRSLARSAHNPWRNCLA